MAVISGCNRIKQKGSGFQIDLFLAIRLLDNREF